MDHPLNNPAWNALTSGNKNLSTGTNLVKYFIKDVSPFAGMAENTPENFDTLYNLLPPSTTVAVFSPEEMEIPQPWKTIQQMRVLQMVYTNPAPEAITDVELVPLRDEHIPAMLALTKLTNPGPFFNRTIDFGNYYGIFNDQQLIAMAGRRLQPSPYMEVSAVCNHPDHLGKGYASQLIQHQVRLIKAEDCTPFLHVLHNNVNAIKLYEKLGFVTRRVMSICAIQKV
ncbi:GNAT family N-acetyltransferase [Mucilaginibacter sp.]|uniref:GNAT family N-acetyltransferase n=1 Tax=Mucilaginibacter sp. TaxID=1882438 RepID=UPI0025E462A2|nr:GNAT family N-acetyltransferase [Mucilaginibacter sp.]